MLQPFPIGPNGEFDSRIPKPLRYWNPRVVWAERIALKGDAYGRRSWLVVQHNPDEVVTVSPRTADSHQTKGRAVVWWNDKATPAGACYEARYYGPDALAQAMERATRERENGPDRSVCDKGTLYPRRKSSRPRDMQRAKAYAWERVLFKGQPTMPREQIYSLITGLCRLAGETPPTFGKRAGCGNANAKHINLADCGLKWWIAAHELAHTLASRYATREGKRIAGHGPEWLACYIGLVAYIRGAGVAGYAATAKDARVNGRLEVGGCPPAVWRMLEKQDAQNNLQKAACKA